MQLRNPSLSVTWQAVLLLFRISSIKSCHLLLTFLDSTSQTFVPVIIAPFSSRVWFYSLKKVFVASGNTLFYWSVSLVWMKWKIKKNALEKRKGYFLSSTGQKGSFANTCQKFSNSVQTKQTLCDEEQNTRRQEGKLNLGFEAYEPMTVLSVLKHYRMMGWYQRSKMRTKQTAQLAGETFMISQPWRKMARWQFTVVGKALLT